MTRGRSPSTLSPLQATQASITFVANLRPGSHYFTGSSLGLGGSPSLGTLQVAKPAAAPGSPDLLLTKSAPGSAAPGSTIAYTLNYSNKAGAAGSANGIQLTDTLPTGVTYSPGSCTGSCSVSADGRTPDVDHYVACSRSEWLLHVQCCHRLGRGERDDADEHGADLELRERREYDRQHGHRIDDGQRYHRVDHRHAVSGFEWQRLARHWRARHCGRYGHPRRRD